MGKPSQSQLEAEGVWDLDSLDEKASKPMQWGMVNADSFKALSFTKPGLTPGVYMITRDNSDGQPIYIKKTVVADAQSSLAGSVAQDMITEISEFWGKRETFKKNGFLHRRGYMLYGPQGTGKSSIVQQLIEDVVRKKRGVAFLCSNPVFFSAGLKTFRQVEPNRPVLCIFEDIDAIIKTYGDDELLSILDGGNQIDHVINVATTNYPELLDKRIISRPRRFDRIHKILAPSKEVRRSYLKMKLPKGENVEKWLKLTDGLSFASLAEAIVSVLCLGNKLDETVATLKGIEQGNPSSNDFGDREKLGFSGDDDDDDHDVCTLPGCCDDMPKIIKRRSDQKKPKNP